MIAPPKTSGRRSSAAWAISPPIELPMIVVDAAAGRVR
jgi:hypothetical protein